FVVELARNLAQRRLARGDHLLRDLAPLVGQGSEPGEQAPVRTNQVEACQYDRDERGGKEDIDLALDLAVDALHTGGGVFFAFVVLPEQPRDAGAEGRL